MQNELLIKLLPSIIQAKGSAEITVIGTSMHPTLFENDKILIQKQDSYAIGDILVYAYKNEGLLVHRLLKHDNRYFCKGDNAFRLEDIAYDQIIGKVAAANGQPVPKWEDWKIRLSYAVSRAFFQCRYDAEKTKQTNEYRLYSALILRNEEGKMMYKKNTNMDYILSDETSLAVFDPDSGTTYFFDETGIDILNALEEPCDLETLLVRLCKVYSAKPDEIRADVEEFLAYSISKRVVEIV